MTPSLRLVFAGTPDFAARHLTALLASRHEVVAVLTQPDRRAGRGKKCQASPVKQVALSHHIHTMQPETLRDGNVQQALRDLHADAFIVVAYGLILPKAVLDIPRFGCINVHASLLPRWRGAAPIQRAIQAGDSASGITIMRMDAGLDTGPMLAVTTVALNPTETGGSLHDRLAQVGPPILLDVLANIDTALSNATPQNDAQASYAAKIDKCECPINWQDDAASIARRIRAFNPSATCFSLLDDVRVKFWVATACTEASSALPGTITSIDRNRLLIACGNGQLVVTSAQFPGGRAMDIAALINGKGAHLKAGMQFKTSVIADL